MFGIIKEKYKDIQNAFSCLGTLHKNTSGVFNSIKAMRDANQKFMNMYKVRIIKVYRLRKKQKSIKSTREVCEIIRIVSQATPTIDQLININNMHTAIEIIENTEKLINERLQNIEVSL